MKSNIVTRLVIDSENSKVYLSVEGKVEKATTEEREGLRDNLVKAFSEVLGLGTAFAKRDAEMLSDFLPAEEAPPAIVTELSIAEDVPETLSDSSSTAAQTPEMTEVVVDSSTEKTTEAKREQTAVKEPTLLFGKYKGITPTEAIAKDGDGAVRYFLDFMLPKALMKDEEKNKEAIASIRYAIGVFKNGGTPMDASALASEIAAICTKYDDAVLDTAKVIAKALGTSYEVAVETKDVSTLAKILGMIKQTIAVHDK